MEVLIMGNRTIGYRLWIAVKQVQIILYIMCASFLLSGCVKEELPSADTPSDNFEALWQMIDERYPFFDYKQKEIGVDWNEVHSRYQKKITGKMSRMQLFEVLCQMIAELRDGHVNLGASFDVGRNWSYHEDYPEEYYDSICRGYLGRDYGIASGLQWKILDDNLGYIRVESFENPIGDGNISDVLALLASCNGLIIDVRQNGGGSMEYARTLASHFTNDKRLVGYVYHKTGKGHNDFSKPKALYLEPADGMRWQKPVVVITNRQSFSATNDFVKMMKECPNVVQLGDQTGGGSGLPFTQELPSGWTVRYSAVVFTDVDGNQIEFGIQPDVRVSMDMNDVAKRKDTLIEAARELLNIYKNN